MAYATINKPNLYFNTILYTGDGTSPRSITGVGFQPNLTWVKNRSQAGSNGWYDSVAGAGAANNLSTDSSNAAPGGDAAGYGYVSSFNADGISVTAGTTGSDITNKSSSNYVDWNWLGSNTTTNNTAGTISSTVCANTTSGFSVVRYTGNGNSYPTGATVGHGLGITPSMIITKSRTEASTNWCVYHKSLPGADYVALLNSDAAPSNGGESYNQTNPTSTVFSVGQAGGGSRTNGSGATYSSYCFAQIKGYSAFGSYTGNGSTNGTFVYTGFKPAFLLFKNYTSSDQWFIMDNKRNTYNLMDDYLSPNLNNSEASADICDFLSNGFKMRGNYNGTNGSGQSYIYMAFAENPLVGTNNIPTTAR